MKLVIYPKLSTRSRRAICKSRGRFGRSYTYRPRENLIKRLAQELNMTREQVLKRIAEERSYLLSNRTD